jgi:hypothetical protein
MSSTAPSTSSLAETNVAATSELDHSDAYRILDSQIALMNASIANLKTRRNALAPIARLPPETLTEIFRYVIGLDQSEWSSGSLRWVRMIGVCRYWHSVMMESPRLWSCLVFNDIQITTEMLRRSKSSPLVVKANLSMRGIMQKAIELPLAHMSRIRVLHVQGTDELFARLFAAIHQPAPLLQSLRLECYTPRSKKTVAPLLPQTATPELRHLYIRNLDAALCLPHMVGLTHLEIQDTPLEVSFHDFCEALARCPALDTLVLTSVRAIEQEHRTSVSVALPKLSHLHLGGTVLGCNHLIAVISFPPTANVVLRCEHPFDHFTQDLPILLSRIVSNCDGGVSISHLRATLHCSSSMHFQAWTTTPDDPPQKPLLDVSFGYRITSSPSIFLESFTSIISEAFVLIELVGLDIGGSNLPRRLWNVVVKGGWQKLQELTVRTPDVNELLSSLTPCGEGADSGGHQQMHLPLLREIALHGVHFAPGDPEAFYALNDFLTERLENGAKIQTLRLTDCFHVSASDVADLELAGDELDVKWYEPTQECGCENESCSEEDEEPYESYESWFFHAY